MDLATSVAPFILRAVSIALGRYPKLNSTFGGDRITLQHRINIGIAVDMNFEGLMVPVLKDADRKRVHELAWEITHLAARACRTAGARHGRGCPFFTGRTGLGRHALLRGRAGGRAGRGRGR